MPLEPEPAPIERRRRPVPPPPADQFCVPGHLFSTLLAGPGLMASFSAAAALQWAWPDFRHADFPLAGLVGLLCGWTLAVPLARWLARRLDGERVGQVACVTVGSGLLWALPAALLGAEIGWQGGVGRMLVLAATVSASGLIWSGYLNFDAEDA